MQICRGDLFKVLLWMVGFQLKNVDFSMGLPMHYNLPTNLCQLLSSIDPSS